MCQTVYDFEEVWERARAYLSKGRWFDVGHTLIVVGFASRLCRELDGDERIVIPAAILHDIGYSAYSSIPELERLTTLPSIPPFSEEIKLGHLIKGAELAKKILDELGMDFSEEVVRIVRHHERPDDSREVLDVNQAIVSDADALSRLTDAGIGCLAEIYGLNEVEILKRLIKAYRNWFLTEEAVRIADEELVKLRPYLKIRGLWVNGRA